MNFGDAIEALKAGDRVTRAGWNGRYLMLLRPGSAEYDDSVKYGRPSEIPQPYISLYSRLGNWIPYTASQSDMLAEDWEQDA